jgi:Protein of unknown function (DUF3501)
VKIDRSEILAFEEYESRREAIRARAMEEKRERRIHLGPALTFLFENAVTMRYQVQEMVRAERMRRPEEIQHEVDTYNEVLGAAGELGCTLLIEIADPKERDEKLRAWMGLPEHLYLKTEDGRKIRPRHDLRQVGEDRLSSVQYLKFPVGSGTPVALGCDLPAAAGEVALAAGQRRALEADLRP